MVSVKKVAVKKTAKKTAMKVVKTVGKTVKKTVSKTGSKMTTINGREYNLKTSAEVVEAVKDAARANGHGKFDLKDMSNNMTVGEGDIRVGGDYKVVPKAVMG
jgi:hypothetical protein